MALLDLIYLDTERTHSLLSQLEMGLTESITKSSSSEFGVSGATSSGILEFLRGEAGAEHKSSRGLAETKSLHDYVLVRLVALLRKEKYLLEVVPGRGVSQRSSVKDGQLVLIEGAVSFDDFGRLRVMLDHYQELARALTQPSQKQPFKADDALLRKLRIVIDLFYEKQLLLRCRPFPDLPTLAFIGPLRRAFLRDDVSTLLTKYGARPTSNWQVLAQVSALPDADAEALDIVKVNHDRMDQRLTNMFDSLRLIEATFEPVRHPNVGISPIAIFRSIEPA